MGPRRVTALLALWAALAGPPQPAFRAHDFHVTYGRLAVEGTVAVARIRFFRDDLEFALGGFGGRDWLRMAADPEVDSLFLAYLADRFILEVDGERLRGSIIGSGEDEIDHEPAWWYLVRFDAPGPIAGVAIRNTLLFELHDDQKNLLKVVRLPGDTERNYTFSIEEPSAVIQF
jgi:hypothetical protein